MHSLASRFLNRFRRRGDRGRPAVGVLYFVGADEPGLPPVLEAAIAVPHEAGPRAIYDVRLRVVWTREGGFEPQANRRRKGMLVRPSGCLCS